MTSVQSAWARRSLLGAALVALGCSPDAVTAPDWSASPITVSANTAAPQPAARYEIKFMTDMIDHHMMAVMTGEMCVEKAIHEDLRQLCEEIIAAQTREIGQMQSWLERWYGVEYEPRMKPGHEREMERLAAFSEAQFEIEFMEMMIQHHAAAVREGEDCLERASHRQLIRLCQNIIETQTAEIELMQSWLCEWYGRCE